MANPPSKQEQQIAPSQPTAEQSSEKKDDAESEVLEGFEDIPPQMRQVVEFGMAQIGSRSNPLIKKISSEHIDKVLDQGERDNEREFKDVQSSRRYGFAYFLAALALLVFLTIFIAPLDKALYLEIVKAIAFLGGGFGAGYGFRGHVDRN